MCTPNRLVVLLVSIASLLCARLWSQGSNPSALDPTTAQLTTPSAYNAAVHYPAFCKRTRSSPTGVDAKKVIPPDPIVLAWNPDTPIEHAFEILWIKLDNQVQDGADGMNIRWSRSSDLYHTGNGAGIGEYCPDGPGAMPSLSRQAPDGSGTSRGNSEPAIYRGGVKAKITMCIKATHANNHALVWAQLASCHMKVIVHHVEGSTGLGNALTIADKEVAFSGGYAGSQVGSDQNGNAIFAVVFESNATVPNEIHYAKVWLELQARAFKDANGTSLESVDDNTWVRVDTTNRIDLYSVVGTPTHQWNDGVSAHTEPWVSAVAFIVFSAEATGTPVQVAEKVTKFLHNGFSLAYETVAGAPAFIDTTADSNGNPAPGAHEDNFRFKLDQYILAAQGQKVNCYDQAASLVALLNLCAGAIGSNYAYQDGFGYISNTSLVGSAPINNPFYMGQFVTFIANGIQWSKQYDRNSSVGADRVRVDEHPIGQPDNFLDRSFFENHAWVVFNSTDYDACCGPYVAEPDLFGSKRDRSTAEEQERSDPVNNIKLTGQRLADTRSPQPYRVFKLN